MNAGWIDYKATNFENPKMPKIYGEPKLGPLLNLHTKIKANEMSVPTEIDVGAHGHLGMAVFPEEYGEFSNNPHERPNTPPELDISGTQYEIAQKQHKYEKNPFIQRNPRRGESASSTNCERNQTKISWSPL